VALKDTLDRIREGAKSRIPPEVRAVMERSTDDLRRSDIMDRVVKVGQPAPDFTLPNTAGVAVRLADLCARGPVVLSFYRGHW
jgi:hypothetical protein